MKKILQGLAVALAVVLLSAGALAAYVLLALDPNDYKAELATLVKRKTDMALALDGRLAWQFYPDLGIKLGATTLKDPASGETLAAVQQAAVSVKLMPLLGGKASINAVLVDGAALRLVKYADGHTSWDHLLDKLKKPDEEKSKQVDFDIRDLDVRNTRLTLVDDASKTTRVVEHIAAQASGIDPKAEFPLAAQFRFAQTDAAGKRITADNDVKARIRLDLEAQHHVVSGLMLASQLAGNGLPAPVKLVLAVDRVEADLKSGRHAVKGLVLQADYQARQPVAASLKSDVTVDVNRGQADLSGIQLDATLSGLAKPLPVSLRTALSANWKQGNILLPTFALNAAGVRADGRLAVNLPALASGRQPATQGMTLSGAVQTANFNPREVMASLGLKAPVTRNPGVLKRASLRADLSGDATQVLARNLRIQLDGSTLSGEAGVRELPAARLYARLALDQLNADDYLPPAAEKAAAAEKSADKTARQAAGLLPVSLLRSQNIDLALSAGSLDILTYPINQFRVAATARGGLVDVSELRGSIYSGSFSVPVSIDVRGAQPQVTLRPDIRQIDLGPIAKQTLKKDVFAGRMNFNGTVKVSGNDADAWLRSAQGPNTLKMDQGLIKGINVTDALFAALGQYQALLPALTGRDNDSLKGQVRDTQINSFLGEMSLNQGVVNNQAMKADLKDIQVGGSGTYNLLTQDVDYRFQLKLDKRYWNNKFTRMADYPIPVHCQGNLKGSLATLCGLDSQGMQTLVAQMAGARLNEALDQQKGRLQDKINEQLGGKLQPQQQEAVKQLLDNIFKR